MKARTLIIGLAVLIGGAATTFAGERRLADAHDQRDVDHREIVVRHNDRDDHHDRDFARDGNYVGDRVIHVDAGRDCR